MTDQNDSEYQIPDWAPHVGTYNYISLLKYCQHLPSPNNLLTTRNSIYTFNSAYYDYFGPPDCYVESDLPNIDTYNTETDSIDQDFFPTQRFHHRISENFLASLDDVKIQKNSLGLEWFHLFLDDGIVAAESNYNKHLSEHVASIRKAKVDWQMPKHRLIMKQYQILEQDNYVDTPCIFVACLGRHNYYHWILEVIPKFAYIRSVPELANLPIIVESFPEGSFQEDTLKVLIGDRQRIWPFGNVVGFRKLIFPSYCQISRKHFNWLRTQFREIMGVPRTTNKPSKKIYISRADAYYRWVKDEDSLTARLIAEGFSVHLLSKMNIRQQIELFSEADIIVMPHGAGGANLVFAPPGCKVVELITPSYPHPGLWILSKLVGHFYGRLICDERRSSKPPCHPLEIIVDHNALFSMLEDLERLGTNRRRIHYPLVNVNDTFP